MASFLGAQILSVLQKRISSDGLKAYQLMNRKVWMFLLALFLSL
jgi:hypothetical protein